MNKFILWLVLTLLAIPVGAQSINGTWVFDRAVDYDNVSQQPTAPVSSTLRISNGQIVLPNNCVVNLGQESYYPGGPFQALLKSGEDEPAIGNFLSKQFNFRLNGTKVYYIADVDAACNKLGSYFLVSDEKLISERIGALFYAFKREKLTSSPAGIPAALSDLGSLKVSRLPFDTQTYVNCLVFMGKRNGPPQVSKRCAPAFFPYVVGRNTKDPLLKLIGAHAFIKGGGRGASDDYDNPVSHDLHPVVVVFPPLKGVVLVRVDDLEGRDEDRDVMSGAYLTIKDGKVTDQLNEGCNFDLNFVCSTPGEAARYKLLENGKFTLQK